MYIAVPKQAVERVLNKCESRSVQSALPPRGDAVQPSPSGRAAGKPSVVGPSEVMSPKGRQFFPKVWPVFLITVVVLALLRWQRIVETS